MRVLGPGRLAREFASWFDTSFFAEGLQRGRARRNDMLQSAAS